MNDKFRGSTNFFEIGPSSKINEEDLFVKTRKDILELVSMGTEFKYLISKGTSFEIFIQEYVFDNSNIVLSKEEKNKLNKSFGVPENIAEIKAKPSPLIPELEVLPSGVYKAMVLNQRQFKTNTPGLYYIVIVRPRERKSNPRPIAEFYYYNPQKAKIENEKH